MQEYLQRQRCYDLLPVSYKSIVLDSRLVVGKALMALLQNGLHSAPVWCASQQRIGDGWTLLPNDFIQLIVNAAANVNHAADCSQSVLMDQLHVCDLFNKHDDQRWSRRRHVGVDAMTNLLEASRLLTQDRRLHNLVLFDGTSATGALVGQMDRQRILKFIAVNVRVQCGSMGLIKF
jgi:hypothetical protein